MLVVHSRDTYECCESQLLTFYHSDAAPGAELVFESIKQLFRRRKSRN